MYNTPETLKTLQNKVKHLEDEVKEIKNLIDGLVETGPKGVIGTITSCRGLVTPIRRIISANFQSVEYPQTLPLKRSQILCTFRILYALRVERIILGKIFEEVLLFPIPDSPNRIIKTHPSTGEKLVIGAGEFKTIYGSIVKFY